MSNVLQTRPDPRRLIGVRVHDTKLDALDALAKLNGTTRSAEIRVAIDAHLKRHAEAARCTA
jgi:hypothetical protein